MLEACEWDSRPLTNVLGYVHKIWSKCEMLPRPKGLRRRRWKFVKYSHFVNVTVNPFPQTLFENSDMLGFLVCYNISAETCLCKQKRNVPFDFFWHWAGHNWLAWIANGSAYESLTFATPPFMPMDKSPRLRKKGVSSIQVPFSGNDCVNHVRIRGSKSPLGKGALSKSEWSDLLPLAAWIIALIPFRGLTTPKSRSRGKNSSLQ